MHDLIGPLALFAAAMTLTPGPNFVLVTASGANFGFRRTIPQMIGITLGFGSEPNPRMTSTISRPPENGQWSDGRRPMLMRRRSRLLGCRPNVAELGPANTGPLIGTVRGVV
jgi:hypothetical protein